MPTSANDPGDTPPNSLRPHRSRKDRPCDHCRKSKRSCHISVRGQPCDNCTKTGRDCSFNLPSFNRHRKQHGSSSSGPGPIRKHSWDEESSNNSYVGGGPPSTGAKTLTPATDTSSPTVTTSSAAIPFGTQPHSLYQPPQSAPWLAERTTSVILPARPPPTTPLVPPSANLTAFLDSLEARERGNTTSINGDASNYHSLDMEVTEGEESHYLGSGAVAQLGLISLESGFEQRTADSLAYRQVADPRYPAYFLRNPSRVYGLSNAAYVAEKGYHQMINILNEVAMGLPDRLVQCFLNRTLPALPILNRVRLEAQLQGWQDAGSFPYALLVSVFAQSAVYESSLRPHIKELWRILVHVLDNEYRQVRLQTLQLEILAIAGRPVFNPGGNHLAICRALGAVQLLGLHRDCSTWKLPKWERSLRKRLWWSLYIFDKWNAYTYGRPMNIASHDSSIPQLTFEDDDWGEGEGQRVRVNEMACFIALCRLSVILEGILPLLLDRDRGLHNTHHDRSLLRHAANDLNAVYRDLPSDLIYSSANPHQTVRAGCRSLQLSHLGISLFICRLGLELEDFQSEEQLLTSIKHSLSTIEEMVAFLEGLTEEDHDSFWACWSAYQLSNAVTFLLQQVIRIHQLARVSASTPGGGVDLGQRARERSTVDIAHVLSRLVREIQRASDKGWEVAEAAMPRVKGLIKSLPSIPGMEVVQDIFDAPVPPAENIDIEPDADILALFDWLNGDMSFVF